MDFLEAIKTQWDMKLAHDPVGFVSQWKETAQSSHPLFRWGLTEVVSLQTQGRVLPRHTTVPDAPQAFSITSRKELSDVQLTLPEIQISAL